MRALASAIVFAFAAQGGAGAALTLTSPDVGPGGRIAEQQAFDGADCPGRNVSPALIWSDVPAGTRSFAVSMIDPDAPLAGGFWHWWVYNLPSDATGLKKGAGSRGDLPVGAAEGRNDFGSIGYGGPCPPKGQPHHYAITVYALDIDRLDPVSTASTADFDAAVRARALAKATLVGVFAR